MVPRAAAATRWRRGAPSSPQVSGAATMPARPKARADGMPALQVETEAHDAKYTRIERGHEHDGERGSRAKALFRVGLTPRKRGPLA